MRSIGAVAPFVVQRVQSPCRIFFAGSAPNVRGTENMPGASGIRSGCGTVVGGGYSEALPEAFAENKLVCVSQFPGDLAERLFAGYQQMSCHIRFHVMNIFHCAYAQKRLENIEQGMLGNPKMHGRGLDGDGGQVAAYITIRFLKKSHSAAYI